MKKPQRTKDEWEGIRDALGTDDLYMDNQGNIRDRLTRAIVQPHRSSAEVRANEKQECKEFFNGLLPAVKEALLKHALDFKINAAGHKMGSYNPPDNGEAKSELWVLSYEELVKLMAEGILLDDD